MKKAYSTAFYKGLIETIGTGRVLTIPQLKYYARFSIKDHIPKR